MTTLLGRRLNGHAVAVTLPVAGATAGSDDLAVFLGTLGLVGSDTSTGSASGGSTSGTGTSSSAMAQTFSVSNWGNATSLGFQKRGVWFKKGDVPAGSVPNLSAGSAQFYGLRYWKDGSLKTARLLLRDTSFAVGESRSYAMTSTIGSQPASSVALAGVGALSSALTGHSVSVSFSNVTQSNGSTSSSYGSGAFTALLATHAATSTRWTVLTTGPIADVWQGWGLAVDNVSGIADAHLKVNWFITRWKNSDGSVAGLQIGAEIALDWWSVAGKYALTYNAVLSDGTTRLATYTGVQHPYQSRWIMAVNDGSNNVGLAPWSGAVQPTLHATIDKAYLVSTGLVPPLNQTRTPTSEPTPAYTPCGNMEHRADIDGTGGYNGRGVITEPDAVAFMRGDVQSYARARVNALAGLGVPYHYRSNRTRIRPSETIADTANTPIALIMRPKAASYYDFTAQGMPLAVDAYLGGNSPSYAQDGYVAALGGTGVWGTSGDSSHAVSYSYFMALISADEWLLEAQIDLAMNLAHQSIYGYHNFRQIFAIEFNSSTPQDYWTGLLGQFQADNMRALGWAQLIQGHSSGLVPADHIAYGYLQALASHNGDYIGGVLQYLPPDFAAAGAYYPASELGLNSLTSPWMIALIASGAYANYLVTEDTRWQQLGNFAGNWTIRNGAARRWYAFDQYRALHHLQCAPWDPVANPMLPGEQQPFVQITPDLNAANGTFTQTSAVYWDAENHPPPPFANGDLVVFTKQQQINIQGSIPAGATEGRVAYVINVTNPQGTTGAYAPTAPTAFQLSATPNGAPLTWTTSMTGTNLGWTPQSPANYPVAQSYPYLPNWDNYVPIHASVIMLAREAGNPAATQAIHDGILAFMAPMVSAYYAPYDMASA